MCSKHSNWNEAIQHLQKGIDTNEINAKSTVIRPLHENANGEHVNKHKVKSICCMECGKALAYYFVNDCGNDDRSSIRPVLCYLCILNITDVAELLGATFCTTSEVYAANRSYHNDIESVVVCRNWRGAILSFISRMKK